MDELNIYAPKNNMCWASKTPCSYNHNLNLKKLMVFMLFLEMLNKLYINLLVVIINLIDHSIKKKIISFFKKKFKISSKLIIFDVGAHKGETVSLFKKNFSIDKIYSFEPNPKIFKILEKNTKNFNDVKIFNNGLDEKILKNILI